MSELAVSNTATNIDFSNESQATAPSSAAELAAVKNQRLMLYYQSALERMEQLASQAGAISVEKERCGQVELAEKYRTASEESFRVLKESRDDIALLVAKPEEQNKLLEKHINHWNQYATKLEKHYGVVRSKASELSQNYQTAIQVYEKFGTPKATQAERELYIEFRDLFNQTTTLYEGRKITASETVRWQERLLNDFSKVAELFCKQQEQSSQKLSMKSDQPQLVLPKLSELPVDEQRMAAARKGNAESLDEVKRYNALQEQITIKIREGVLPKTVLRSVKDVVEPVVSELAKATALCWQSRELGSSAYGEVELGNFRKLHSKLSQSIESANAIFSKALLEESLAQERCGKTFRNQHLLPESLINQLSPSTVKKIDSMIGWALLNNEQGLAERFQHTLYQRCFNNPNIGSGYRDREALNVLSVAQREQGQIQSVRLRENVAIDRGVFAQEGERGKGAEEEKVAERKAAERREAERREREKREGEFSDATARVNQVTFKLINLARENFPGFSYDLIRLESDLTEMVADNFSKDGVMTQFDRQAKHARLNSGGDLEQFRRELVERVFQQMGKGREKLVELALQKSAKNSDGSISVEELRAVLELPFNT